MRKPADGRAARGAGGGCGALRVKWNGCPSPTPAGGQERRRRRVRPRLRRAGQEGGRARGGWGRRPAARERGARGGTPPPRGGRAGDVSPAGRKGRARGSLSILFSHDLREPRVARTDGPGRPQESKASTGKGGHECLQYLPDRHVQEQPPPPGRPKPHVPAPRCQHFGSPAVPLGPARPRSLGAGGRGGTTSRGGRTRGGGQICNFSKRGKVPSRSGPSGSFFFFSGKLVLGSFARGSRRAPRGQGREGQGPAAAQVGLPRVWAASGPPRPPSPFLDSRAAESPGRAGGARSGTWRRSPPAGC